ncbi:MAG: hypothetical protein Q4G46_15865, partial [Propionibacteriaceae bacterium]|nr:hypothetical protein [Propionibacteriaceae bacterium]
VLPVRVVNKVWDLPEGTLHRLSSVQLAGRTCIEVDQMPGGAEPRGALDVPTAGIVSVAVDGQGEAGVFVLPDGAILEVCDGRWAPLLRERS